jgi:hypothetical protein
VKGKGIRSGVLVLLSMLAALWLAGQVSARVDSFSNFVPLYVPHQGETYPAGGAVPSISLQYVKQSNQVDFRACASLVGDGAWMLTYPEAGDPINFSYATPTWACIDTPTGTGGGTIGFPLQLWLGQTTGGATVHMMTPNIFVSTSGVGTPATSKP